MLLKSTKKVPLHASTLVIFYIHGHYLPVGLNIHWLFITCNVLSFGKCMLFPMGHMPYNPLHMSLCQFYLTQSQVTSQPAVFEKDARFVIGGGRSYVFPSSAILPFVQNNVNSIDPAFNFSYMDHVDADGLTSYSSGNFVHTNIPLSDIIPHIPVSTAQKIAKIHHISIGSHIPKKDILGHFENHNCGNCNAYSSVFSITMNQAMKDRERT